ncbi:hypothetical protein GCM10009759_17730 [Kitasatospora saccharophila]|uniref:Uncharacterized protein n=1 Tax=Kitasatospora saccharophila TaxID=407973 RepID=A0ABN2WHI8_9ACTN
MANGVATRKGQEADRTERKNIPALAGNFRKFTETSTFGTLTHRDGWLVTCKMKSTALAICQLFDGTIDEQINEPKGEIFVKTRASCIEISIVATRAVAARSRRIDGAGFEPRAKRPSVDIYFTLLNAECLGIFNYRSSSQSMIDDLSALKRGPNYPPAIIASEFLHYETRSGQTVGYRKISIREIPHP